MITISGLCSHTPKSSKLGRMVRNRPDFIDARVKINNAYSREVLLTQRLLSVMREIFIFQKGNVPAHRAHGTNQLSTFRNETPASILPDFLPPNSTDLNPIDYNKMGEMQQRDTRKFIMSMNWSSAWLRSGIVSSKASSVTQLISGADVSLRVNLCETKTFWAFNLTPIMQMLFVNFMNINKCYWVKCSRISPISFFYI